MASEDVIQLSDREHVRSRVGMYMSGNEVDDHGRNSESLITAIREASDNSIDELISGNGDAIWISKDKTVEPLNRTDYDGKSVKDYKVWYRYTVADTAGGIPIKATKDLSGEEVTMTELAVGSLRAGSKFDNRSTNGLIGLNGVGVSATNFTSAEFSIYSHLSCHNLNETTENVKTLLKSNKITKSCVDEWYYKLTYNLGIKLKEELVKIDSDEILQKFSKTKVKPSTVTTFIPDPTIHNTTDADLPVTFRYLKYLNPNFKFYVNWKEDKDLPPKYEFSDKVVIKRNLEDIKNKSITFNYSIGINKKLESIRDFSVNTLSTQHGTHERLFDNAWTDAFCDYFKNPDIAKYATIGLNILCVFQCPEPNFSSQTKERLSGIDGFKASESLPELVKSFKKIISSNEDVFKKYYDNVVEYYTARQNIGKLKELKKQLGDMASGANRSASAYLPKKLLDCSCKDRQRAEVFMCFTGDTEVIDCNNNKFKFSELVNRDFNKNPFYTFSSTEKGEIIPAKVISCKEYKKVDQTVKVYLDNNESFECTLDHKILMKDGSYKEAKDIIVGDSCMPLYLSYIDDHSYGGCKRAIVKSAKKVNAHYRCTSKNNDNTYNYFVYRIMSDHKDCIFNSGNVVHHLDHNPLNDYPTNLQKVDSNWHRAHHGGIALLNRYKDGEFNRFYGFDDEKRKNLSKSLINFYKTSYGQNLKKRLSVMAKKQWSSKELRKWKSNSVKNYAKTHHKELSISSKKAHKTCYYNLLLKTIDFMNKNNIEKTFFNIDYVADILHFKKGNYTVFSNYKFEELKSFKNDVSEVINMCISNILKSNKNITYSSFKDELFKLKKFNISRDRFYKIRRENIKYFTENELNNTNHKVQKIEFITHKNSIPVYCLTVDNDYHNFPLAAGIFVRNCEGASAAGGFIKARAGLDNIAVMPLRGKVLNTVGMDTNKALENAEISDITYICGGVDDVHLPYDKLHYGKYIIASDADADGSQIGALLLGDLLQNHLFLFGTKENNYDDSRVFVAKAALYAFYKIDGTKNNKFFYAGQENLVADFRKNHSYKIEKRFKGLGECKPEELKEMYLDENTRCLLQVKPINVDEALNLIDKTSKARQELMLNENVIINDLLELK